MDCHISTAFRKDFARAEAKMALKLFIRSLHHAAEMALDPESPGFLGMFIFLRGFHVEKPLFSVDVPLHQASDI